MSDQQIRFAKRLEGFGRQTGFEIKQQALKLEAQGSDIIHLEVGEPDFPTPSNIVAAAKAALDSGQTHYAPSAGLPVLRRAVAEHVARKYDNDIAPAEVVIAPGAKPLIFFSLQALVDPGETVLIPDINFPAYEAAARIIGARIDTYPLLEEKGFRPDLDVFRDKVTGKGPRLVILNSPHNPTGGMLTAEDYTAIAEMAHEHDFWVLSDEIYSAIVYEGQHVSALSEKAFNGRLIMVDGWSKAFAMTGWRLGYGVMPAALARKLATLTTNSNSCTCTFNQYGALEAIVNPISWEAVDQMRNQFRKRRDYLIPELQKLGCSNVVKPKGAFYAFANLKNLGLTSREINDRLLNEAHIAALHGTAFGEAGEGYIRFSFANSLVNLQKFIDRFGAWMDKNCNECVN